MKNNYKGLKIGVIFSLVSFLLTFTLSVPMGTVMPAVLLQSELSNLFINISLKAEGLIMIFLLSSLFILTLVFTLKSAKKTALMGANLTSLRITGFMFIFYFIVHSFVFYIFWGVFINFKSDALIVFDAVYSFPFSSLSFVIIGFLIDWYWKKYSIIE